MREKKTVGNKSFTITFTRMTVGCQEQHFVATVIVPKIYTALSLYLPGRSRAINIFPYFTFSHIALYSKLIFGIIKKILLLLKLFVSLYLHTWKENLFLLMLTSNEGKNFVILVVDYLKTNEKMYPIVVLLIKYYTRGH